MLSRHLTAKFRFAWLRYAAGAHLFTLASPSCHAAPAPCAPDVNENTAVLVMRPDGCSERAHVDVWMSRCGSLVLDSTGLLCRGIACCVLCPGIWDRLSSSCKRVSFVRFVIWWESWRSLFRGSLSRSDGLSRSRAFLARRLGRRASFDRLIAGADITARHCRCWCATRHLQLLACGDFTDVTHGSTRSRSCRRLHGVRERPVARCRRRGVLHRFDRRRA